MALLEQWRSYNPGRFRDERARAIASRLIGTMVKWLEGNGPPPDDKQILAALKSRPNDSVFYGSQALHALALLEPGGAEAIFRLFPRCSIRACESLLMYIRRPIDAEIVTGLVDLAMDHGSPAVRRAALSRAYEDQLPSFSNILLRIQSEETDECTRRDAERYANLRRQGYHAAFQTSSWSWSIDYECSPGRCTADVPKAAVDALGLEMVVRHLLAHHELGTPYIPWDDVIAVSRPRR